MLPYCGWRPHPRLQHVGCHHGEGSFLFLTITPSFSQRISLCSSPSPPCFVPSMLHPPPTPTHGSAPPVLHPRLQERSCVTLAWRRKRSPPPPPLLGQNRNSHAEGVAPQPRPLPATSRTPKPTHLSVCTRGHSYQLRSSSCRSFSPSVGLRSPYRSRAMGRGTPAAKWMTAASRTTMR